MIRPFVLACASIAVTSVGGGIYAASIEPQVYDPPRFYTVRRTVEPSGGEKVLVDATVFKRQSCDLESGSGPVWVDFYAADPAPRTGLQRFLATVSIRLDRDPVPPSSTLWNADGKVAGETRLTAGESMIIRGYSAAVPPKLEGLAGEFRIRVPCQLWSPAGDGRKVWGRQVVATLGPLPLPLPGRTVTDYVPLVHHEDAP